MAKVIATATLTDRQTAEFFGVFFKLNHRSRVVSEDKGNNEHVILLEAEGIWANVLSSFFTDGPLKRWSEKFEITKT
ncbi:MAG: hypothetical protein AAB428_01530 [Patescibacteria group bacterium]